MVTRRSTQTVGDDAVVAATGQPRAAWFELLDAHGATGWDHTRIASWLVENQGVDGWWAQSLTVAYEQERGLRLPGQRADGTFDVSVTKTVAATPAAVYAVVSDDEARSAWLGPALAEVGVTGDLDVVGQTIDRSVRLRWPTDAVGGAAGRARRVLLAFDAAPSGVADGHRTRVAVSYSGVPTAEEVAPLKTFWKGRLDALATLL
ncbi:hypothetical protein EQW78_14345 [Oerskovia turbata]|uniref:DUF4287 domain-containing protein n=1 Tax=Oerskovia turbata TaxID=1713 RepID=A0A4Q1KS52_9CELL|nr:SRPBCC family protein [Oerskovia turbata]RXR22420.1 hypothetical protein EQW73_16910 [Oerskovia turbata]RXR32485.1 hypothetical protein EQW78_14345 [Oerskovia turbata]TGJ95764.1 hypothetical protein DLJ96_14835 [Actinotalea fermentans ATCC 43279 = JCM 9966 = DSM 3133]